MNARHLLVATLLLATPPSLEAGAQEPATPAARWGHGLCHDPVRNEVLLFGGASERGTYRDDTWTWDGAAWTHHDVAGPRARGFAGVAFHAERGTIVLHGGRAHGRVPHSDTWEWDGTSWSPIEEDGPFASDHHGLVYLEHSNQLLAYGGWNGAGVIDETWVFDTAWHRLEIAGPPPRSAFGMAYDSGREVAVVAGGLWIEGQYADVWEFASGAWRAASGPYDNSSIDHLSLAFDPVRDQVVGFGGKNYKGQMLDRTFRTEGGALTRLADGGPVARHSSPLAWDGASERLLLFGGKVYEGEEQLPLGDLWAWDGRAWTRLDS